MVKKPPVTQERRIPRTEEPGGLQSMGLKESDTTERLTLTKVAMTHAVLG